MEESVNIRDRIQGLSKWMVRLMYLLGLLLPLLIIIYDGYTLTVLISLLALSLFNALLRYGTALRSENELTI
ncbi:hypothetical protein [uncultured Pseudoteredinibacter sp.]|uniref:hypothetical protein n=1 Tax=uncultured Pseudoteredinibacter sp. TaxID=1641701 RepID=UPI002622BC64|nr:hypothetical protein [uncultured Pseudoteredinibacter sp.]